ncbi:MAG: hypothetical protein IJE51_06070 [Clostridia bacterium]|nr:hypothetical protein [Clostridia bacterium]
MKKYLFAIVLVVLAVCSGCENTEPHENDLNNDEIVQDEIFGNDGEAVVDPNEEVFVKTSETDALAAELYEYIPFPNAYVCNETVNVNSAGLVLEDPINERIIKKAIADLGIDKGMVDAESFLAMCRKMYGPDFEPFPPDGLWYSGPGMIFYDSEQDGYYYTEDGGMGVNWFGRVYHKMTDYEIKDEFLYIYDKFGAVWDTVDSETGTTKNILFGECVISENSYSICKLDSSMKIRDLYTKLSEGEFDELLPTYKHTFAKADDDSYYWLQTEMVMEK